MPMRRLMIFGALVLTALSPVTASAQSFNAVSIAELISNPGRHSDKYVVVEGLVRTSQWTQVILPDRGQSLAPMFLMTDGNVGIWIVIIGGPHRGGLGPPPDGSAVRVYGIFRAGTRSIETDRGITLR